jgi:hypothetical protein
MDYRGVLLIGMLAGATLVGATTSCSGPDPGSITFSERPRGSSGELTSGGNPTADGGPVGEGGTPEPAKDGGTSGKPADPVFGTTTFAAGPAGPPVSVAKAANPMHGGDASGKDCVTAGCHLDARPWAFAGTLYVDATGGAARVPNAEIRITGPDAKVYATTYSDIDGNFWFETGDVKVPAGSRVGVRNGTKLLNMAGVIGGAQVSCQSATCHGAGNPGKVFLK